MGQKLYERHPLVREILDECDRHFARDGNVSLLDVMFGRRADQSIDDTRWTQPALFALEYAIARLWMSWGVQPAAAIGHSIGEFAAACVAGVLSLEDALRLVSARGALMDRLPRDGAMVALRATETAVGDLVRPFQSSVDVAAVNGPGDVVISGRRDAVAAVVGRAEEIGIKTRALNVSHAFHSPAMDAVLPEFEAIARLVTFGPARIPIASNVTGRLAQQNDLSSAEYWCRHLRGTVRFEAGIRALADRRIDVFLEVGPAPTLVALATRILDSPERRFVASLRQGREDWTNLLEGLAALYVAGVPVDWNGFHRHQSGRSIALPLTPFERSRYWLDTSSRSRLQPVNGEDGLRGRRVESPAFTGTAFEVSLSAATHAYLFDHSVGGRVIAPAAALIELIRANAGVWLESPHVVVTDLVLSEPLALERDSITQVQILFTPAGEASTAAIYSRPVADHPTAWVRHADARVSTQPSASLVSTPVSLEAIRMRCTQGPSPSAHYSALAERGLDLGPAFQVVTDLWKGDREALGRVRETVSSPRSDVVSPTFLDGAIQVAATALDGLVGAADPYLPFALQSAILTPKACTGSWIHATVRSISSDQRTLTVDIDLLDEGGTGVGRLEGLSLRPAASFAPPIGEWFYEPVWRPMPLSGRDVSPVQVGGTIGAALDSGAAAEEIRRYEIGHQEVEALSAAYVERAFRELGWTASTAEASTEALCAKLGIAQRHQRLFERLLNILEEAGAIARDGSGWRSLRPLGLTATEPLRARIDRDFPECGAEATLLGRCGEHLAGALRGEIDPLELLFPGGDGSDAERLYRHSPAARLFNRAVQRGLLEALGGGLRGRRILEIGGGTASTTEFVREVGGEAASYTFTDVSPTFVARAAKRFEDWPAFTSRVLDLERDPEGQGFADERFDVVLAVNVVHATKDLAATLGRVRRLLAPGGLLVLVEVVRPQSWIDLTFGLTPGWWAFADHTRRSASPLLSAPEWVRVLAEEGFESATAVWGSQSASGIRALQSVVLASESRHLADTENSVRRTVIHAASSDGSRRLAEGIAARDGEAVLLTSDDSLDVLATCDRLIYVADRMAPADESSAALMEQQRLMMGRLLECSQALVRAGKPEARCWIVTRGASAVTSADPQDITQSTISGFVTALQREQPGIHWVHVDLDPMDETRDLDVLLE